MNPCTSPAVCSETNDACSSCDTVFPPPTGAPSGYSCFDASDAIYTSNCGGIETVIIVNTNTATYTAHTSAPSLTPGFRLAEPRSATLNSCYAAIADSVASSSKYWIGADDIAAEGEWRWESNDEQFWSGTAAPSGSPVGGLYSNWETNEPNNIGGDEDCAVIISNAATWNDEECALDFSAIYELVP